MARKTGDDYRHMNKIRVQRHREVMKSRGYKPRTLFLSEAFRDELKRICSENRLPQHKALDLILENHVKGIKVNAESESLYPAEVEYDPRTDEFTDTSELAAKPAKGRPVETEPSLFDDPETPETQPDDSTIPDCREKDLSQAEKDDILIGICDRHPGRTNSQKRVNILNKSGLVYGEEGWNSKKVSDHLRFARKRVAKRMDKK